MKETRICILAILLLGLGLWSEGIESRVYEATNKPTPKAILPLYTTPNDKFYINVNVGTPPQRQRMELSATANGAILIDSRTCTENKLEINCFNAESSSSFSIHKSESSHFLLDCSDVFQLIGLLYSSPFRFSYISAQTAQSSLLDSLPDWQSLDGVLGLNSESFTTLFPSEWDNIIAFDMRNPSNYSLALGGYEFGDEMEWSEMQLEGNYFDFPMYALTCCSLELSDQIKFRMARFSSDTSCLYLPTDLFYSVASWVPARCEMIEGNLGLRCYYGFDVLDLVFTFRLSAAGKEFTFLLSTFITKIEYTSNSKIVEYCIIISDYGDSKEKEGRVVLGALFWKSYYIAVDYTEKRIGLAQNVTVDLSRVSCPMIPVCHGDQVFRIYSRQCENPKCSAYFFQVFDPSTLTCQLDPKFLVCAAIVFLVIAFFEYFVAEVQHRFIRRIHTEKPYLLK